MLKRDKKFISIIAGVFFAAAFGVVNSSSVLASSNRLWGADRYATSAAISSSGWTSSDYVVIASGEGYADALCAAPLAKKYNAPILLTESKVLNSKTKQEIKRLNAKHVIIIGKYGAVSQSAESELKSTVEDVVRLGGDDRYETSVIVAKAIGTTDKVVITSGNGFADALSIAPIAAMENIPILLTRKDALPEIVQNYINENKNNIKNSYVVGGTGVISDAAANQMSNTAVRLSGKDRFETNLNVMKYFEDSLNLEKVYVAQGDGPIGNEFADALSGAVLAAKNSSPIVLTYKTMSKDTQSFIQSKSSKNAAIIALGGASAVPEALVDNLQNVILGTEVPGGSAPAGGSSDVNNELSTIATKLNSMIPDLSSQNEKNAAAKMIDTINKMVQNSSYDYTADVDAAKNLYNSLTTIEKSDLQNKALSKFSISELLQLKSKFGL